MLTSGNVRYDSIYILADIVTSELFMPLTNVQ